MKRIMMSLLAMLTLVMVPQQMQAQDKPIKIVTNHPDCQVKVKRCVASGKTVVLDLVFNNLGEEDVYVSWIAGSSNGYDATIFAEVYDDEGNIYKSRDISVKIANESQYGGCAKEFSIVAGVPLKVSYKIDGVSLSAESLARILIPIECGDWGLSWYKNNPIIIRNVPISRN